MKKVLFLFCLSLNKFSSGQTVLVKEIKQVNPLTKELYVFPDIISPSKTVAQKINDHLRSEILDADPATAPRKIFDHVWRTKEQSPTVSNITYAIIRNNRSILSLSITAEGCGAYCETGTTYFTFNLHTGNKLTLDSLFTKQGAAVLVDSLNVLRSKKIKAKIRELQNILKTKKNKTEREQYQEMLKLYRDCLDQKLSDEFFSYLGFAMTEKKIKIYSDRCSAHYNMAIDELWVFEYTIDLKNWRDHLTNLGLELIK
ncbi:MAG TPA: hypothetical protein VHL77_07915 [Ferruginibacter sp.]|jgi:hypothetical protein|nr:hypothetical protein [Ferruginibacter sp.]